MFLTFSISKDPQVIFLFPRLSFSVGRSYSEAEMMPYFCLSSAAEQMDQISNRSGVASDDITDETTSLVDVRWSSDEEVKDLNTPLSQII